MYEIPVFEWYHKVVIVYPRNPREEGYTRVEERTDAVGTLTNLSEIVWHHEELQRDIQNHRQAVRGFARFLHHHAIEVAYEEQLNDVQVANTLRWLERKVNTADFTILVVTPSLNRFLLEDELPREESSVFEILHNLIRKYKDRILPVFLDQDRDESHLPLSLMDAAHVFEVHSNWFRDDLVREGVEVTDMQKLYQIITRQSALEDTRTLDVYYHTTKRGNIFLATTSKLG